MEMFGFSLTEVFNEVLSRRQTQGAFGKEAYMELVDEVLEEKRELGEIDDDFDLHQAREDLLARWPEVAEADGIETEGRDREETGESSADEEEVA